MLVVSQIKDQALAKKTVDKLLFAMAKPKVRPANSQKEKHSLTAFPNEASKEFWCGAFSIKFYDPS